VLDSVAAAAEDQWGGEVRAVWFRASASGGRSRLCAADWLADNVASLLRARGRFSRGPGVRAWGDGEGGFFRGRQAV